MPPLPVSFVPKTRRSQFFFSMQQSRLNHIWVLVQIDFRSRLASVAAAVNVIKQLFCRKSRFPQKLRNWKKFVMLSEHALKCENNAIFEQKYTLNCYLLLKRGNLDIPGFLQKKFYNINSCKNFYKLFFVFNFLWPFIASSILSSAFISLSLSLSFFVSLWIYLLLLYSFYLFHNLSLSFIF